MINFYKYDKRFEKEVAFMTNIKFPITMVKGGLSVNIAT